jgi:deazaflavin-dependent oxidoreductase (nitroreductase family)
MAGYLSGLKAASGNSHRLAVRQRERSSLNGKDRSMSDADAAAIRNSRANWATDHVKLYRESGGAQGHVMDLSAMGGRKLTTHCLIRYVGRKSGNTMLAALIYGNFGGEVVICASKGGADQHPAWYLNIVASKELQFQIATQAFRASWREPVGAERTKVWEFMQGIYPPYTQYQASTQRQIPLVMLAAIEPVAAFRP